MSEKRDEILAAGRIAVDELIKVLKDPILTGTADDLSADKMKTAAAAKRLAFEDAIAILTKIEDEQPSADQAEISAKAALIPTSFVEHLGKDPKK